MAGRDRAQLIGSMSGSLTPKGKAIWTPPLHRVFVDVCLEQTRSGNRPGTHFTREGWSNVIAAFNKRTGLSFDKKKLKNHWEFTLKQWKIWCKLISTSRMRWDPETNTFDAGDEDWAEYIQDHPDAAQFRSKELPLAEKLEIIFDFTMKAGDPVNPSPLSRVLETPPKRTSLSLASSLFPTELDVKDESSDDTVLHGQLISGIKLSSEQSISSPPVVKPKAYWTIDLHKVFVDLCLDQVLKGNRPRTHFTKEAWRNILESFHERTGIAYDRIQFKHHWDHAKAQWKIWRKLVATSSMKWDPSSNKFGANEDEWENYIQENPEAAQFRFKELDFVDKLNIIFDDGTINVGEIESPSRRRKLDGCFSSHLREELKVGKPDRTTECHCDAVESRTNGITVEENAVAVQAAPIKLNYTIGECIECLDGMVEVEQGSDLYLFALDIFLRQEYREIFLQLKKPSVRIAWLQRLQSAESRMRSACLT